MNTSNSIAVIGDKDSILVFKAFGMDIFPAEGEEQARKFFEEALKKNYPVILVTEELADKIQDKIRETVSEPFPSIISIPNNKGSLGLGINRIRDTVRKATGADVFR